MDEILYDRELIKELIKQKNLQNLLKVRNVEVYLGSYKM